MKNMDNAIDTVIRWGCVAVNNMVFGFFVALFISFTDLIIEGAASGNDQFTFYWLIATAAIYITRVFQCWSDRREERKILRERKG
jgi:hypothetical protein